MKRKFTVSIDSKFDNILNELKSEFGQGSKVGVFKLAIALLKVAANAKKDGFNLAVVKDDIVLREIKLPSKKDKNDSFN